MTGMTLAAQLTLATAQHPRPDFERTQWQSLNGAWEFQFDPEECRAFARKTGTTLPRPYARTIRVPYAWESQAQRDWRHPVQRRIAWYRREFSLPDRWRGQRIWLCFGAVDHHATVWVNGARVGEHEGGYSEFRFDITPACALRPPEHRRRARRRPHRTRNPTRQASARLVHQR
jgi:beta-galactosidase/beta-glucuronidase